MVSRRWEICKSYRYGLDTEMFRCLSWSDDPGGRKKEYKVSQRYPNPLNTASATATASASVIATPSSDRLSRGILVGAIVGFITSGALVSLGVFYLINCLRRRAQRQETGKEDGDLIEDIGHNHVGVDAILGGLQDRKVLPGELAGHEVNEMENIRANEMPSHSLAEMWAEPVELVEPRVSTREGDANDAIERVERRPKT
jgi:hypothetical protein